MSMFMPENAGGQTPGGVSSVTPADPETTSEDVALMQRVLSAAARNPNLIPDSFMAYMLDWIQTQRLSIPIGQVFGFRQQNDVRGRVSSAGATINGVGFSASRLGVGLYQITFTTPLTAVPAILATVDDNSATLACKASNASTTLFQVDIYDMAGVLTDAGFYFTASPFV